MIQTIDFYDFRDAFKRYGRGDHFSHEALVLLFDYIEQYEQDTGVQQSLTPWVFVANGRKIFPKI
jgi:hypothetical protein